MPEWVISILGEGGGSGVPSNGSNGGLPPGVWVGVGPNGFPPSDADGSTGGLVNPNSPFGGGPVWVSKWVEDNSGCTVSGDGGNPNDGTGGGPVGLPGNDGDNCSGGNSGHWESVEVELPEILPTIPNTISDFSDINNPITASEEPIINNGILVNISDINQPSSGRLIGHTAPRGNVEDMLHGLNGNTTGITTSETSKTDDQLFSGMTGLMHGCTILDGGLTTVADLMTQKFRNNSGGTFENDILSSRVAISSQFTNFAKNYGDLLNTALRNNGGDISNISDLTINNNIRPKFDGMYNKFHGLQVLINDTEQTTVQLDSFNPPIGGHWSATLTFTIIDHFGLDKHDALLYQNVNYGFADWWLLQHNRDYTPFQTVIRLRVSISGNL